MDKKYTKESERTQAPHARQGTKLRDILMLDKPTLSYADFHHQIIGNDDERTLPKSSGKQNGRGIARKATAEDEMVRYMSKLPSYLENGGRTARDKTFNVGVLDWGRLEKWRSHQKQVPSKDNGQSPSSSSTSYFSTDGSSTTHSSRRLSCSPSRPRVPHSLLQSHRDAPPCKNHHQDIRSYFSKGFSSSSAHQINQHRLIPESHYSKVYPRECNVNLFGPSTGKLQEEPPAAFKRQENPLGADQHLRITEAEIRMDRCQMKESVSNSTKPTSSFQHEESPQEGRMKARGGHVTKEVVRLQDSDNNRVVARQRDSDNNRMVARLQDSDNNRVVARQRDSDNNRMVVRLQDPNSREVVRQQVPSSNRGVVRQQDLSSREVVRQQDPNNRESVQRKKTVVVLLPKGSSLHSRSEVKNDGKKVHSASRNLSGDDLVSRSDIPYSCPLPSTTTNDCIEESCSNSASGSNVPSQPSCVLPNSSRMSYSPSRSKIIAEEKSVVLPKSTTNTVKSSADLDMRKASESTTKGRSASPIKRLSQGMGKIIRNVGSRDNSPLRRSCSKDAPAKSGSDRAAACSKSDSSCIDKPVANDRSRSSPLRRLLDPLFKPKAPSNHQVADPLRRNPASTPTLSSRSAKVQPRLTSGRTISYGDSQLRNKSSASSQALFQVALKNGLPLFTFAVGDNSEILAAALRKSSPLEKNHDSWIYTFFTVHEVKKRNGLWIHQGSKATNAPGYVPNIVAQMKVSDPEYGYKDREFTREFTLVAVDVGHEDQHTAEIHPTNELAAIVVRKPKVYPQDDVQPGNTNVSEPYSHIGECLPEWNKPPVSCFLSTTVILPGGVHTVVPSKGAVSTLTQRWKSGGSCDCGGWDLGCQLRVYTNRNEPDKEQSPSGPSGAEFKLFSQAIEEDQPTLRLTPFKERIRSVEFSSSLSLLQAFAICVAVSDCKRPSALLEPSNIIALPSGVMASEEAPARYATCPPPHSPVDRV